jgi:hypothetical protein
VSIVGCLPEGYPWLTVDCFSRALRDQPFAKKKGFVSDDDIRKAVLESKNADVGHALHPRWLSSCAASPILLNCEPVFPIIVHA